MVNHERHGIHKRVEGDGGFEQKGTKGEKN